MVCKPLLKDLFLIFPEWASDSLREIPVVSMQHLLRYFATLTEIVSESCLPVCQPSCLPASQALRISMTWSHGKKPCEMGTHDGSMSYELTRIGPRHQESLETAWKSLKPALKPGTTLGKSLKPVILIKFSNGWKKILLKSPVSRIFRAWCPVSRPVSRIFKRFQDFLHIVFCPREFHIV